jgi:hypothetical protein
MAMKAPPELTSMRRYRNCRGGALTELNFFSKCEPPHTFDRFLELILRIVGGWAVHVRSRCALQVRKCQLKLPEESYDIELRQNAKHC